MLDCFKGRILAQYPAQPRDTQQKKKQRPHNSPMVPFETTPTQTQAQTQNDQRYITDSCTQQRVGVGHEIVDSQQGT